MDLRGGDNELGESDILDTECIFSLEIVTTVVNQRLCDTETRRQYSQVCNSDSLLGRGTFYIGLQQYAQAKHVVEHSKQNTIHIHL